MIDFTREEVIQVVLSGRKCDHAYLSVINLSEADLTVIATQLHHPQRKSPE